MTRVYHCPVEVATDVIGGRWTAVVLSHVKEGAHRYSQLRRLLPGISDKVLTERLRELEAAGILERRVVPSAGTRVEYELTDLGRSLGPVLQALHDWGESWAAAQSLVVERLERGD